MIFLNTTDICKAAATKYSRKVKTIEPIDFTWNNVTQLSSVGVCVARPTHGFYCLTLARQYYDVVMGNSFQFDKCFFGDINFSYVYDKTNDGFIVRSNQSNKGIEAALYVMSPTGTIEWKYAANGFVGAPAQAAMNFNLKNVFFDSLEITEPQGNQALNTCFVTGAGYIIQF